MMKIWWNTYRIQYWMMARRWPCWGSDMFWLFGIVLANQETRNRCSTLSTIQRPPREVRLQRSQPLLPQHKARWMSTQIAKYAKWWIWLDYCWNIAGSMLETVLGQSSGGKQLPTITRPEATRFPDLFLCSGHLGVSGGPSWHPVPSIAAFQPRNGNPRAINV